MKIYSQEEAYKSALNYFKGDDLAAKVWVAKYAMKDSDGNIYEQSPVDMHWRLANEIARIEKKYPNPISADTLFALFDQFKYIVPQGSPMTGIGNNFQIASLSNCFVIGLNGETDSYGAIMKIDEEQIQLMKRRGGVGHDLSHIRPKGSPVHNSALTSTGIVPFMERYSNSTREVAQDGRRGALMLSVSINHPDSNDFIDAKMEQGKITGANVSVKVDDTFMEAVVGKSTYVQKYPIYSKKPLVSREIEADKLWRKLIHNAWKSAEPGILFWDTIIRESLPDCYADLGFGTVSTNPCLVADTKVFVADGRGFVTIGDLAKDGKDVPVFCYDNDFNIVIKTMRNPRLTGYNQKIYKITLDSGDVIRCTGNHKFLTSDYNYKKADELIEGDGLHVAERKLDTFWENTSQEEKNSTLDKHKYFHIFTKNKRLPEHRLIAGFHYGEDEIDGKIVHHIDEDRHNNSPLNLKPMHWDDHHSYHMQGENNPIYKIKSDPERFKEYSETMSKVVSGEKNPRYIDISNEEIFENLCNYAKEIKRPLVKSDIISVLNKLGLSTITNFRQKELGTYSEISKNVSKAIGFKCLFEDENHDSRLVKSAYIAMDSGYDVKIENNKVLVIRVCEECGTEFWSEYRNREVSFCSTACGIIHTNKSQAHKESIRNAHKSKGEEKDREKEQVFTDLKFKLKRNPLEKEFIAECKKRGISSRLNTTHGKYKKWSQFVQSSPSFNHRIVSIELDGYEDVYNGTVDEFHNFFIGDFGPHYENNPHNSFIINNLQCGEIPLCPYDSCRLTSINLYSYVKNPFTSYATFDFELFSSHVEIAMRVMDDIVDLEAEKIKSIIAKIESDPEGSDAKRTELELWNKVLNKTLQGRRTGLGITAEGDMLAAMGLTYGTKEATDFSEQVHKVMAISAYCSSVTMAKERGEFPVYDAEREAFNPFLNRLFDASPELENMMMKHGRRNIACLTIAPTGTTSLMTQTSSGIEPVFLPVYKRRRRITDNDKDVRVDFVDAQGDKWQEYVVFHHKFKTWMETNGICLNENPSDEDVQSVIELSPYYKATSNDVDWLEKVEMQGRIQKWVDHSISVTINLPKDVSEELVNKLYIKAWEVGCKGCTVYRDGSRDGVLVSAEKKEEKPSAICKWGVIPERPEKLEAEIVRFNNNKEKWIAFFGLYDGKPYEIFTGLQDDEDGISLPATVTKGLIIKSTKEDGSRSYDFQFKNKKGYKTTIEGLNGKFNPEFWNYAKLISGVLRYGMPLDQVVKLVRSLDLKNDTINTWKNGLERALKRFIPNGDAKGQKCPKCEQETLIYQEGCLLCTNCGSSKCG